MSVFCQSVSQDSGLYVFCGISRVERERESECGFPTSFPSASASATSSFISKQGALLSINKAPFHCYIHSFFASFFVKLNGENRLNIYQILLELRIPNLFKIPFLPICTFQVQMVSFDSYLSAGKSYSLNFTLGI